MAEGKHFIPIYVVTGVLGLVFICGPFMVPKSESRGITRCCIMLTAFCMWLFWITIYVSQLNPLMGPRMENTTLAWMASKWGLDIKNKT
ncbi:V-type proton ATPase subunit e-like [Hyposmocoma kahamanoa]|uniref:V-type proton ATPase subunit e-like n=1 Tax=Hyposmocoma kahamanoa TaxID=1477025 RepID=UPI000E6D6A2A|nr:V-type proton ATPase subunit e-like [Hyposmocoma kahamanoa]